jgi:serine protease Do
MNGQKVVRPYMGIRMLDMDEEVCTELRLPADTQGAVIVEVVAGSPAAQGGLRAMDVIQKLDGKVITSGSDVQATVERKKVGEKLTVEVLRQGKTITLTLTLAAKP